MNAPITITATLPAWVTSSRGLDRMLTYIKAGKHKQAADELSLYDGDMDKGSDQWTRVGVAEVTVTIQSENELVANQLQTLQGELDHERAKWLTKQQEILERISKLQALTNEVEA